MKLKLSYQDGGWWINGRAIEHCKARVASDWYFIDAIVMTDEQEVAALLWNGSDPESEVEVELSLIDEIKGV